MPERDQDLIELFAEAGRALYGPTWQSALARELGVDSRRVRQWLSGERPIPQGVWGDMAALARSRSAALEVVAEKLAAARIIG